MNSYLKGHSYRNNNVRVRLHLGTSPFFTAVAHMAFHDIVNRLHHTMHRQIFRCNRQKRLREVTHSTIRFHYENNRVTNLLWVTN